MIATASSTTAIPAEAIPAVPRRKASAIPASGTALQGAWYAREPSFRAWKSATARTTTATAQIDNGALCPSGTACINCQCVTPCEGEFCPQEWNASWILHSNACFGVRCGLGETCVDGECVNFCDLQTCNDGFMCDPAAGLRGKQLLRAGLSEGELC
jgi:hypothetical protein